MESNNDIKDFCPACDKENETNFINRSHNCNQINIYNQEGDNGDCILSSGDVCSEISRSEDIEN